MAVDAQDNPAQFRNSAPSLPTQEDTHYTCRERTLYPPPKQKTVRAHAYSYCQTSDCEWHNNAIARVTCTGVEASDKLI